MKPILYINPKEIHEKSSKFPHNQNHWETKQILSQTRNDIPPDSSHNKHAKNLNLVTGKLGHHGQLSKVYKGIIIPHLIKRCFPSPRSCL